MVAALGSAWTTAGLYPDVSKQEPFRVAAIRISRYAGAELRVRAGGFVISGDPVPGPDAAGRLANALFLHGTESLGFTQDLTPESLAHLLKIVALAPEVVDDQGGLEGMVAAAGLVGIRLTMRNQLAGLGGDTPEAFTVPDEPDIPLEMSFLDQLELVAAQPDADERTAAVMGLIDEFTGLAPGSQAELIDRLLGTSRADLRDLFLDQLAPNDLARVVEHLDPTAFRVLGEYVSYVEGPRRGELTEAIGDPASVLRFRARVAESVRERMTGIQLARPTSAAAPSADFAVDHEGWFQASTEVMQGVALVEDRPDRQGRVAEAWKTRVDVSLAGQEDEQALAWYNSIIDLDDPPDPLAEAVAQVPDTEQIKGLLERRRAAAGIGAREFVELLMGSDPGRVIGPLADAGEDSTHLAALAGDDPETLLGAIASVDDPLPVIVALKAAGYRGADPRLIELLDSPETHGRAEILVLVGPSLGVDRLGRLLLEEDEAVSRQAAEILRRGRTTAGLNLLFQRFESEDADDPEREFLAHLLAGTGDGANLLKGVMTASNLLTGHGRSLRAAARSALGSAEEPR